MSANWMIASYYTPDYEKFYIPFTESYANHGIKFIIIPVKKEKWHKAVAGKMKYILDCFNQFPDYDFVWCDIDAVFREYPALFDEMDGYDFAAHKHIVTDAEMEWIEPMYGFKPEFLYYTGTMFFKNNERTRKFLDLWIKTHEKYKDYKRPTQASLYWTLKGMKDGDLTIYDLPSSYCYLRPDIVVEHFCETHNKGI